MASTIQQSNPFDAPKRTVRNIMDGVMTYARKRSSHLVTFKQKLKTAVGQRDDAQVLAMLESLEAGDNGTNIAAFAQSLYRKEIEEDQQGIGILQSVLEKEWNDPAVKHKALDILETILLGKDAEIPDTEASLRATDTDSIKKAIAYLKADAGQNAEERYTAAGTLIVELGYTSTDKRSHRKAQANAGTGEANTAQTGIRRTEFISSLEHGSLAQKVLGKILLRNSNFVEDNIALEDAYLSANAGVEMTAAIKAMSKDPGIVDHIAKKARASSKVKFEDNVAVLSLENLKAMHITFKPVKAKNDAEREALKGLNLDEDFDFNFGNFIEQLSNPKTRVRAVKDMTTAYFLLGFRAAAVEAELENSHTTLTVKKRDTLIARAKEIRKDQKLMSDIFNSPKILGHNGRVQKLAQQTLTSQRGMLESLFGAVNMLKATDDLHLQTEAQNLRVHFIHQFGPRQELVAQDAKPMQQIEALQDAIAQEQDARAETMAATILDQRYGIKSTRTEDTATLVDFVKDLNHWFAHEYKADGSIRDVSLASAEAIKFNDEQPGETNHAAIQDNLVLDLQKYVRAQHPEIATRWSEFFKSDFAQLRQTIVTGSKSPDALKANILKHVRQSTEIGHELEQGLMSDRVFAQLQGVLDSTDINLGKGQALIKRILVQDSMLSQQNHSEYGLLQEGTILTLLNPNRKSHTKGVRIKNTGEILEVSETALNLRTVAVHELLKRVHLQGNAAEIAQARDFLFTQCLGVSKPDISTEKEELKTVLGKSKETRRLATSLQSQAAFEQIIVQEHQAEVIQTERAEMEINASNRFESEVKTFVTRFIGADNADAIASTLSASDEVVGLLAQVQETLEQQPDMMIDVNSLDLLRNNETIRNLVSDILGLNGDELTGIKGIDRNSTLFFEDGSSLGIGEASSLSEYMKYLIDIIKEFVGNIKSGSTGDAALNPA